MAPSVIYFLFLLATMAASDVTTLTSQTTLNAPAPGHFHHEKCGEGDCICLDDHARCEDIFSVIPSLPSNIVNVSIHDGFFLSVLSTETAAELMSLQLRELRLEDCDIETIEPAVLATFRNLSVLSLNRLHVTEEALRRALEGLSNLRLELLELQGTNLQSLFPLTSMQSTTVVALDLSWNNFVILNMRVLQTLTGLSKLTVQNADVNNASFVSLPDLKYLDLSFNNLRRVNFCSNGIALLPKLKYLFLSNNRFAYMSTDIFQCLTSLRILDISHNPIKWLDQNVFLSLESLEEIYMNNLIKLIYIEPYAFNNSNVFYLDISDVRLSYVGRVFINFFAGCSNLTFLDVSGDDLSTFPDQNLSSMFSNLPSLQELSAARCRLKQFPDFLGSLLHLIHLDLSHNMLTTPSQPLPREVQVRLRTVDLGDNLFQCSCSWLWLKEWIARNTTRFLRYPQSYVCSNPPHAGVLLEDFPLSKLSCLLSETTRNLVVALFVVLVFVVSILLVVYRYRWHIQYLAFMLRYDRQRKQRNAEEEARHFRFDAFVIYDSRDHAWVVRQLMPALEDAQGLRLCLHERNFLAGKLIVDNIVDSISASRKVIAVISEGTATSEWCQFELSLTHRLTLERGRDLMVVVMLEKVARAHVTRTMYAVFKTTTYITWRDEDRAREAFWSRLGEAVRD